MRRPPDFMARFRVGVLAAVGLVLVIGVAILIS